MGAGKTSVGRVVAARLGWAFVDNDEALLALTGMDGATLLADRGGAALGAAEAESLQVMLAGAGPAVVAVAAGVVLDPVSRRLIASAGFVVWLRADPAVLAQRVAGDASRARLGADPQAALEALATEREQWYAALADLVLDATEAAAEELAERVVVALGGA